MTDAQHLVRVELMAGDEIVGLFTLNAASLLDAIKLPDGRVLGFDRDLVRFDSIRLRASPPPDANFP